MGVYIRFDPEVDAIYAALRRHEPGEAVRTRQLDERRMIDYDVEGEPIGVELLYVSEGIDFEGLPRAEEIREALAAFPIVSAA
jgi:uncharacterized protein YuzE